MAKRVGLRGELLVEAIQGHEFPRRLAVWRFDGRLIGLMIYAGPGKVITSWVVLSAAQSKTPGGRIFRQTQSNNCWAARSPFPIEVMLLLPYERTQ
ncbi:MAG: hypothetical protein GY845_28665 [Planctomycetes bacterium]|nr:hypothetical protein [Planctomycetota bacterium]